jgi:diguanylate cyclase (GGDEF)-like protein/PAS domain S-box-containing protein
MKSEVTQEELEILATFPEENPNPVMRIGSNGRIFYANTSAKTLLESSQIPSGGFLPSWLMEKLLPAFSSGTVFEVRIEESFYHILSSQASRTDSVFLFWQEVTLQKKYEALLHLSTSIIENTSEGIFVADTKGKIERINPAFTTITGFDAGETIGSTPRILKSEHQDAEFYRKMWEEIRKTGTWAGEIWNRKKDGAVIPVWLSITSIQDAGSDTKKHVAVFHDMSRIKHTEEKLKHQTYYDPLTTLPNRLLFYDRLDKAIASARRNKTKIAVLLLDIDDFKKINDSLGHYFGDRYLKIIGERLKEGTREEDTIARLGGDEFALLQVNIHSQNDVIDIIGRVKTVIGKPVSIEDHELVPSASVGVTFFPDDGTDADTLLKNADLAMYQAKKYEKGGYALFNPVLHEKAKKRIELEMALNRGFTSNEFLLHYQPKVDLKNDKPYGFEALIRWKRNGNLVSPADFIPVVEETGLIFPLGRRIIDRACRDLKILHERIDEKLFMSVNLSPKQFQDTELVAQIGSILKETEVDPGRIYMEITENMAVSDVDLTLHMMQGIEETGVRISIDDFGTGYSSLAYIKRFTAHEIKIDKSFVEDLPDDPGDRAIVQAVVTMAHNIGMWVVAEGVETREQVEYLKSIGCDAVQGYFYSKPLPIEELFGYLDDPLKK